ncbi:MAG: methylmalonyl-CoA mutase [Candidatus Eisenbacteria bacterium]|uniref:Methylmalonyl-CoA mutase n=1 Tax=Eiseniibacteriota bacterium TaxID=2212470 RepID=A0A9D6QMI4_UNCEI|nr:methylmalonyl-CoA mutase [Candidatus Eisenbacteria bacterium]MBI3539798.1 methylmalonyl-CoA mutase [Candidatus Eisenbacteria bacterium]
MKRVKPADARAADVKTTSDIPIRPVYEAADLPADLARRTPPPGTPPYTRGIHPAMYRSRLWTMRQYAGFGTAQATNERFRFLLTQGQTGLSVAFDLPTQMGYDSDSPRARGEVGKVGVAISCLADMEALLAELPLDRVTTSMTINATAPLLLALYVAVADARGVERDTLGGTVQNDVLKEYIARGTYIYPPEASLRLITDVFDFTTRETPQWNSISVSGYHMREAGSTAAQELAFTIADGLAYLEAARARGLDATRIAKRMSFFFNAHNHLFEEVAKFRAARKLWAELLGERFGVSDAEALKLRFHTQTAGSMLTAQQPLNNVVRVAYQGLAAVLGGTQSLHTNSYDEALGLPGRDAALLALRTQQVIAHEIGAAETADPLAGSYVVESLTADLERKARAMLDDVARQGGMLAAIASGWVQRQIHEAAYRWHREVESGERVVVGVNAFTDEDAEPGTPPFRHDPRIEKARAKMLATWRSQRAAAPCRRALARLEAAARGTENLMPPILDALVAHATLGEVCDTLRGVFGTYAPEHTL